MPASLAGFKRSSREREDFVHGFAKNERDNIRNDELAVFKMLAADMLAYDDAALDRAVEAGVLTEVMGDK